MSKILINFKQWIGPAHRWFIWRGDEGHHTKKVGRKHQCHRQLLDREDQREVTEGYVWHKVGVNVEIAVVASIPHKPHYMLGLGP
jgi:hypothetical protein